MNNLRKSYESIKREIENLQENVITDGIIDIETYCSIPENLPRILWILKEPNSSENKRWSYSDLLINDRQEWDSSVLSLVFKRIIYTSYGILNQKNYNQIPSIHEKEVYDAIRQIAYINLKKTPGSSVVKDYNIALAYNNNKELILKQIEEYQPQILIFGNTMKYLFEDLGIKESDKTYVDDKTHNTTYYIKDNKLYIHAWHPAARIASQIYCDEIISIANKWWKQQMLQKK